MPDPIRVAREAVANQRRRRNEAADRETHLYTELLRIAEAARAWRHGNCPTEELIQAVDEFEAALTDEQLAVVEAS